MIRSLFIVLSFLLLLNPAFAQQQKLRAGIIAFYNLENFFDTINNEGVNDVEFTPESAKRWNSERYYEKIDRLAEVISKLGSHEGVQGPAIIGLCELENRGVLEDLIKSQRIKHLNYRIVHYNSPDRRGMDVALLYQPRYFRVTNTRSATLDVERSDGGRLYSRDQLVVSGVFDGEPMHFIVNHWPSRFGGSERSNASRFAAAQLSRSIVDSITNVQTDAKIMVLGDFNDDPVDESIAVHLNAKGNIKQLKHNELFNPMWDLFRKGVGTLAYQGKWNLFDQIVISQSLLDKSQKGYYYHSVRVFNEPFMLQKEGRFKGYPLRSFVGNTYHGGYSDHFPVYIMIVKQL